MKVFLLFTTLMISNALLAAPRSIAEETCLAVFKQDTLQTFHGTNATSIRMSSRVRFEEFPAKNPTLILLTISANFYVKWPDNYGEVASLGGGSYVYDSETRVCESAGIIEFGQLKK